MVSKLGDTRPVSSLLSMALLMLARAGRRHAWRGFHRGRYCVCRAARRLGIGLELQLGHCTIRKLICSTVKNRAYIRMKPIVLLNENPHASSITAFRLVAQAPGTSDVHAP
jgi:hypothetical protein